jgi:hypothetical protein
MLAWVAVPRERGMSWFWREKKPPERIMARRELASLWCIDQVACKARGILPGGDIAHGSTTKAGRGSVSGLVTENAGGRGKHYTEGASQLMPDAQGTFDML